MEYADLQYIRNIFAEKVSSLERAYVETFRYLLIACSLRTSSLERAYVETLCVKSSVIKRETFEFAVDRQSCKNALHIDSSFNTSMFQVMSSQASFFNEVGKLTIKSVRNVITPVSRPCISQRSALWQGSRSLYKTRDDPV